jgi:hypothetical protein
MFTLINHNLDGIYCISAQLINFQSFLYSNVMTRLKVNNQWKYIKFDMKLHPKYQSIN